MGFTNLWKQTPLAQIVPGNFTFGQPNMKIQGTGYYNNEPVTIIDSHKDKLLIISNNNPIESEWVTYTELDNIVWVIDGVSSI